VSENLVTSEGNNTKGFVTATVQLGGTGPAVRFVCTHLDSRNPDSKRAQAGARALPPVAVSGVGVPRPPNKGPGAGELGGWGSGRGGLLHSLVS
jgi:hypothetical protein